MNMRARLIFISILIFCLIPTVALIRELRTVHLKAEPWSRYEYSNVNYVILGQAIAAASGQKFADYIQANIFTPLGMQYASVDATLLPPLAGHTFGVAAGTGPRWTSSALANDAVRILLGKEPDGLRLELGPGDRTVGLGGGGDRGTAL
jgi:CubicO group peptidase (beta-lactamase class C family)